MTLCVAFADAQATAPDVVFCPIRFFHRGHIRHRGGFLAMLALLMLVTLVPGLSLWLPGLFNSTALPTSGRREHLLQIRVLCYERMLCYESSILQCA